MMAKQKVGVIGLGNMGYGIACNLINAGFPVIVWDNRPEALKPFEKKKGRRNFIAAGYGRNGFGRIFRRTGISGNQ